MTSWSTNCCVYQLLHIFVNVQVTVDGVTGNVDVQRSTIVYGVDENFRER